MYTELVIGCRIPASSVDAIRALENWGEVKLGHPLFQTDRWDHIGCLVGMSFATKLSWLTAAANRNNIGHGLVDDWHLEAAPEELARAWRVV